MRVTPLASGSQGNATLLEFDSTRVLVDIGLEASELEARLDSVGVPPRTIDAALVTHRHKDHIRGATDFCKRHRVRIYTTRRTSRSIGSECHRLIRRVVPEEWFEIAPDVRALAVPVEHDAPDTVAFVVESGGERYGHATDLGNPNGRVRELLTHCEVLYLEFNHDRELLAAGPYPEQLKRRIGSDRGHLNNDQAADLLRSLAHPGLRHVWVAHVSQANNTPAFALAAADAAVRGCSIALADQDTPSRCVDTRDDLHADS